MLAMNEKTALYPSKARKKLGEIHINKCRFSERSGKMDPRPSVLLAYPENGYPMKEYNGKPVHEYMGKRVCLIQRILREQYGVDCEVRLLRKNDVRGLEAFRCVVPFMAQVPQNLAALGAKNALYIRRAESYTRLDMKSEMVHFDFVDGESIPQIPTLCLLQANEDEMRAFVHAYKFEEFLFKPEDGAGSLDQAILNRIEENKMYSFLGQRMVMQPYLKEHDVFAINALMVHGEVAAHFGSINVGGLVVGQPPVDYIFDETVANEQWQSAYARILEFTRSFSRKHHVGGIIEIEFLQPKGTDKLFLLEVNPRISGWVESFCNEVIPFVDILMVPYLRHFGMDISPAQAYDLSQPLQVYHPADDGIDATEYYDSLLKMKAHPEMPI